MVARAAASLALISALFLLSSCSKKTTIEVGDKFSGESDVVALANKSKFVVIGRIEMDWPAEVVKVERAKDELSFEVPGSGMQTYSGLKGYTIEALVMKHGKTGKTKYGAVVLRSE